MFLDKTNQLRANILTARVALFSGVAGLFASLFSLYQAFYSPFAFATNAVVAALAVAAVGSFGLILWGQKASAKASKEWTEHVEEEEAKKCPAAALRLASKRARAQEKMQNELNKGKND